MHYIYKIVNKIDGKVYIGQTSCFERRIKEHIYEASKNRFNTYLYNALNKYGLKNFDVSIVEDNISKKDIDKKEIYYIKKFNSYKNGYNLTTGGDGVKNYVFTDEVKHKISEALRSNKDFIENARIIGRNNSPFKKGYVMKDSTKKKLSIAGKERVGSKNSFYGKHHSDKTKNMIRSRDNTYIIYMCDMDGKVIHKFNSTYEAAMYMINNKLSKSKIKSIMHGITMCYENRYKYSMGFIWKCAKRSNDYPEME